MRLLFSCQKTFLPTQGTTKTSPLAFLQLAVQPKLHSTHHLLCHDNPHPIRQWCNFAQAPTLLFVTLSINTPFHPPNSGATISIPPTVQFPKHKTCFCFFPMDFAFPLPQLPQTHSKTAKSTCFPTAINLHFPTGLPSGGANFCPLPKSRFVRAFLPSKACAFCTAKNVSRCN